jgi:subtilase family serine protease
MKTIRAQLNVEWLEARELLSVGYTPAQIRHAYGFDQLWLDGRGQTIAIVDAYDDPNIVNDLRTFDRTFGLPDLPRFTKVNQSGRTIFPKVDAGWAGEITLDVEWAHAIAPGANILLVEANSSSLVDLYTAVDYARHQPGVVTVSMSFGGSEGSYEPSVDSIMTTPAGHIGGSGLPGGITFVASTGDNGAPGGYPAYSPNVVAVGGTSLFLDDGGDYLGEAGWSGSGGGISRVEPEPAYQYSVQNTGTRTIPDVSYDADPNTGFWIYNTVGSNGWSVIGGTSAGAPQWAALMALVDQGRAYLTGAGSLDGATQTLPALYAPEMSGDFFDIMTGYNGYLAGPGYDLVTGLGSPYAPWVVSDLAVVETGINVPNTTAKTSSRATLPPGASSPLVSNPLQIVLGAKKAADAVFAEPSFAAATIAKQILAPMSSMLPDQAARPLTSDAGSTPVSHSAASGEELDLSDLNIDAVLSNLNL